MGASYSVASASLNPTLAARYIAHPSKMAQFYDKSKETILFENAMGELTAQQAQVLIGEVETAAAVVEAGDMTDKEYTDKVVASLLDAKVRLGVQRWVVHHKHGKKAHHHHHHHHHHEQQQAEDPASFFHCGIGMELRAELRYDVCDDFDYDGTTMHAAAGTVRYVERVGLNPQATAFESNRTADTEDTARDQQARCSAQSRDLQLTLKTLRTKEAKCSGTLLTATASGSVFKVHDATKALEEATGKVQKAVSKQATLEQKVRVAERRKEAAERKWIAMASTASFRHRPEWSERSGPGLLAPINEFTRSLGARSPPDMPANQLAWGVVMAAMVARRELVPEQLRRFHERLLPQVRYTFANAAGLGNAASKKRPDASSFTLSQPSFVLAQPSRVVTLAVAGASEPAATPEPPIDFLVLHCAGDDLEGQEKARALEAFSAAFEAENGRPPLIWFDKVCADTTDAAELALLLPVAMSSCKRTLLLYSDGCRSDLWVLYGLFLHCALSARGEFAPSIDVINLLSESSVEEETNFATFQKVSEFNFDKAKCFLKQQTPTVRAAINVCPNGKFVLLKWINAVLEHCYRLATSDHA
jgi:hypothetical protein